MAFRNVIRVRAGLSGMSDCILHLPQVYLRDLKNSYVGKKFEHRSDLVPSTRKKTALPDHIWPAMNTDFEQNPLRFSSKNGFWSLWRPFSALGRLHRFQDHVRTTRDLWGLPVHRYWPPTLDSSDFHSIFEREQCKSLTVQ